MNSDFRIKVGFTRHPKVLRLIRESGVGAAWALIRLWEWAAEHAPKGDLTGLDDADIDRICEAPGIVETLAAARFMDGEKFARKLHAWREHQPWVFDSDKRSRAAKKSAKARWQKEISGDAARMRRASQSHSNTVACSDAPSPSPSPSPTLRSPSENSPNTAPSPRRRGSARAAFATEAKDYAYEAWRRVHGVAPSWREAEFKYLYDSASRCVDLSEFRTAWDRFLTETHPTIAQHDPKTFCSKIDRWRGNLIATLNGKPAPGSCRNCKSDLAPGLEFCNGDCRRAYERRSA